MTGEAVHGTVLHCSRFGCIVRLEDGRLGNLPMEEDGSDIVRRAMTGGRRPRFPFIVLNDYGRRVRLALAQPAPGAGAEVESSAPASGRISSSSLEQKIIEYLRQTAEWDPQGATLDLARLQKESRADRLLPFEARARSQYRDSRRRPRPPKAR